MQKLVAPRQNSTNSWNWKKAI